MKFLYNHEDVTDVAFFYYNLSPLLHCTANMITWY